MFLVGVLAACEDDEPDHDYLARGEEACEVIWESPEDKPEDAPCVTWACATDEVLECSTNVPYGIGCDTWAENYGCDIGDVIRVYCDQCSNW